MSQPASTSSFQDIFNIALQDYENQTGTALLDHPLFEQLQECDSVGSITAILQEQAHIFSKFRGDDGRIIKSIKSSVDVLYTLSNSTVLGQSISLVCRIMFKIVHPFLIASNLQPFPPANAIFAGIAILLSVRLFVDHIYKLRDIRVLQAVKDVSASYDALVDLFASFENFLNRLRIYIEVPPVPALTNILVKIIVELLSTLALATKQVKQGRFSEFVLTVKTLQVDSKKRRNVYEKTSRRK